MATDEVASPGHKLGQIIGVLLERTVGAPLQAFATRQRLYCDRQGERPAVRPGRKVTWADSRGNPHDLDYVLERNGSDEAKGDPVAFIESAWRRYTKHSRNKSGELEGALLPLRDTYGLQIWFRSAHGAIMRPDFIVVVPFGYAVSVVGLHHGGRFMSMEVAGPRASGKSGEAGRGT